MIKGKAYVVGEIKREGRGTSPSFGCGEHDGDERLDVRVLLQPDGAIGRVKDHVQDGDVRPVEVGDLQARGVEAARN